MKSLFTILASVLGLTCATVAGADGTNSPDPRQLIALDAHGRAELLSEMRGHLVNVQALLEGLAKADLKSAANAASASGLASASEAADDLVRQLPKDFTALGMRLHQDFDRIADAANQGRDARQLLLQLADTMQKCVACHALYKLRDDIRAVPKT